MEDLDSIQRGHLYLFGVFAVIVLLQISYNIIDEVPLTLALIRMSALFVLFYYIEKGFSWSKWLLSVYLFIVGIAGFIIGLVLIANKDALQGNLLYGITAALSGIVYISSLIVIHLNADIKLLLAYHKKSRLKEIIKNHIANIIFVIGVATIICVEVELLPHAFARVIELKNITKKIFGLIFLLPVKIPFYAIPGLVLMLISKLIHSEKKTVISFREYISPRKILAPCKSGPALIPEPKIQQLRGLIGTHELDDPLTEIISYYVTEVIKCKYDLKVFRTAYAEEILEIAKNDEIDLFILMINNIIGYCAWVEDRGAKPPQLVELIKTVCGKPVIALAGWMEHPNVEQASRDADFFFQTPFRGEPFMEAVEKSLRMLPGFANVSSKEASKRGMHIDID